MSNENKPGELFERYIQSVERTADLISFRLREVLEFDFSARWGEPLWLHELGNISCFLDEEGKIAMEECAPDGYEGMVLFYDLYAEACRETASAIDHFREADGTIADMLDAFSVLKAHNHARDSYLTKIDFPAWL